ISRRLLECLEQAVLCLDRHLRRIFHDVYLVPGIHGSEHGIGLDAAYQVHAYAWTVSIDAYEIGIGSVFHEKAGLAPAAGGPVTRVATKQQSGKSPCYGFFADTLRS